jgi:hypothetical protein
MNPLLILLIVVVVLILLVFGHLQSKRRREELLQLAMTLGGEFHAASDSSLEYRFPQFPVFSEGDSRYAYNRILGTATIGGGPWRFEAGDYHYETTSGSGKDRKTHSHHFSFLILQLPYLHACQLAVRQEGLFDKLAAWMGFDDIDFESAEFSRRFHVKSDDKRFAYDVIDARMMEFLLESNPPNFEVSNRACCLADARCWEPERFKSHLAWAKDFFERWPRHVVDALETVRD